MQRDIDGEGKKLLLLNLEAVKVFHDDNEVVNYAKACKTLITANSKDGNMFHAESMLWLVSRQLSFIVNLLNFGIDREKRSWILRYFPFRLELTCAGSW